MRSNAAHSPTRPGLFLIRLIRDIRGRNPVWERWFIPFADLTPWAFEDDITASGPAYEQAPRHSAILAVFIVRLVNTI